MPEKFTCDPLSRDMVNWAFIEAVAGLAKDHPIWNRSENDRLTFEVEMRVDGHEVSFSRVMSLLDKNFENNVESRAKKLLEERATDLLARLTDLRDHIDQKIKELFPEVE